MTDYGPYTEEDNDIAMQGVRAWQTLTQILLLHAQDEPSRAGIIRCRDCEQNWPCNTRRIIEEALRG